jgi:hypothetical protein
LRSCIPCSATATTPTTPVSFGPAILPNDNWQFLIDLMPAPISATGSRLRPKDRGQLRGLRNRASERRSDQWRSSQTVPGYTCTRHDPLRAKPGRVKRHAFFCHQPLLVGLGISQPFPRLVGLIRALPSDQQVCICQPRRACVHQSLPVFQRNVQQKGAQPTVWTWHSPRSTPSLASDTGTFVMDVSLSKCVLDRHGQGLLQCIRRGTGSLALISSSVFHGLWGWALCPDLQRDATLQLLPAPLAYYHQHKPFPYLAILMAALDCLTTLFRRETLLLPAATRSTPCLVDNLTSHCVIAMSVRRPLGDGKLPSSQSRTTPCLSSGRCRVNIRPDSQHQKLHLGMQPGHGRAPFVQCALRKPPASMGGLMHSRTRGARR